MGQTSKPCHGCGSTRSHETGKLCRECQAKLDKADAILAQAAVTQDEQVIQYGRAPHWNQYFHTHIRGFLDYGRTLQSAFYHLAEVITRPYVGGPVMYGSAPLLLGKCDSYDGRGTRIGSKAVIEAVITLHQLMQPMLDAVYEQGKTDGTNLLIRLANGDLSPNAFLEAEQGKKQRA